MSDSGMPIQRSRVVALLISSVQLSPSFSFLLFIVCFAFGRKAVPNFFNHGGSLYGEDQCLSGIGEPGY